MASRSDAKKTEAALRTFALAFPGTHEDFPWGERALKVGKKVFVFMRCDEAGLSLSVKLPSSRHDALAMPFCQPTHYGLGKSGWVTASFEPKVRAPLEPLKSWIEESYAAVAPKKLARQRSDER